MNFLITITSLALLTAMQTRFSSCWWLGGVRVEFLPALVAYGALTFRHRRWAAALAVAAGFFQDALSAGPFGNAVAGYAVAVWVLSSLARLFDREMLWMQMLSGAIASVAVSLAACAVVGFSRGTTPKILLLAAMSAVVAPLVFLALDGARWWARRTA